MNTTNGKILKKKTIILVKELIENNYHLRDDDKKLFIEVVKVRVPDYNIYLPDELLYHIATKVESFETVSRSRRLLQEKYPNLRGNRYYERNKLKEIVTQEVINFKNNL